MNSNSSVQLHMRFVTEKHQELIKAIDDLVKALVSENLTSKKTLAQDALQKSNTLKSAVSAQDCPSWLQNLINGLECFIGDRWNQENLINHIIALIASIKGHLWLFENQSETTFDFDSIYERYKSESKLPKLFDEIIRILEDIEASGEIDSIAMTNALEKVISTIKKNKDGSYFSLNSAWEFLISFLKNYMWTELTNIPVLGTALEALKKTIDETNEEMSKVHSQIQKELSRTVEIEVKGLKNKTSFKFLGYDKSDATIQETPDTLSKSKIEKL